MEGLGALSYLTIYLLRLRVFGAGPAQGSLVCLWS